MDYNITDMAKTMDFWGKARDVFLHGGLTHAQYRDIKPLIGKNNLKYWRAISLVLTAVFLASYLFSLNLREIAANRIIYIVMLALSAIVTALFLFAAKPYQYRFVAILMYVFYGLVLGFSVILGTTADPTNPASTYFVVLVAVPMVIRGRPWIANAESLISIAVFCVLASLCKEASLRNVDVYNACLFGAMSLVMHFFMNYSSLRGFYAELTAQRALITDALTGLENELSYVRMVELTNQQIAAGNSPKFAVVMMDLNGVKPTNDQYGHAFGCALIVEAGHYVKERFPHSRCFHVGGDEYVVKLLGEDYENREQIFQEFAEKMDAYFIEKEGVSLRVSLAHGLSCYQKGKDERWNDILQRADKAMYVDKAAMKKKYGIASRKED